MFKRSRRTNSFMGFIKIHVCPLLMIFFKFSASQSQAGLAGSIAGGKSAGGQSTSAVRECPLCMAECTLDQFPILRNCPHLFCMDCLHTYTKLEIHEGRVNLKCPQCNELIHPNGKEFCLKLSELVQTCLELFKLVQTCLYLNIFIIWHSVY